MLARRLVGSKEVDPYWNNVELLINPAGADGSTSFTDLSGKYTISTAGSVTPTVSSISGKKAVLFSNGRLIASDPFSFLNDSSSHWTIDIEFFNPAWSTNETFVINTNYAYKRKYFVIQTQGDVGNCAILINDYPILWGFTVVNLPANQLVKLRVTRTDTTMAAYVNGVAAGSATKPSGFVGGTDANTTNLYFGQEIMSGAQNFPFSGYMTGIRITKNVVRPGSELFTVPFPTK